MNPLTLLLLLLSTTLTTTTALIFNATFDLGPTDGISIHTIDTSYNPITNPTTGSTVTTGTTFPLKWTRTTPEFIEFKLFIVKNDSYYVWADLVFNVKANTPGSYDWSVAETVPSGNEYVLTENLEGMSRVFSVANPDMPAVSSEVSSSSTPSVPPSSSSAPSSTTPPSSSSTPVAAAGGVSSGTSSTATTENSSSGTSGTSSSSSSSSGSGSSTTGTPAAAAASNTAGGRGGGGLSTESKIGLGVGITFGVIATVTGLFQYFKPRNPK